MPTQETHVRSQIEVLEAIADTLRAGTGGSGAQTPVDWDSPHITGVAAFDNRPRFNGLVPYDTGNLPPAIADALAPYLKSDDAGNTYITPQAVADAITDAIAPYLKSADAAGIYATQNAVAAAITAALVGYLKSADAQTKYLAKGLTVVVPEVDIQTTAGAFGLLRFMIASRWAWSVGLDQSGAFKIWRYNDQSVVLDTPLVIDATTGLITLAKRPMFGSATAVDSENLPDALAEALAPYITRDETDVDYMKASGVGMPYFAPLPYIPTVGITTNTTQIIASHVFPRPVTFVLGMKLCVCSMQVGPDAAMQFEVFKNGGAQPVAFLVMFPGATSGKFNQSSGGNTDAISFATGDTLTIVGPIGHAGPLAGISITLCGLITG